MIDYKLFEFAAPPCTNEQWYMKACQLIGLGPGFSDRAHGVWERGSPHKLIRLSLVRNPVDWLIDFYEIVRKGAKINGTFEKLSKLSFSSLNSFFDSYLEKAPGSVTALYNRYEADIVHRAEDIPWAFIEFSTTLEVPDMMKDQLKLLTPPVLMRKNIPPWIRREIQKSESEVFERYDFW